MKTNELTDGIYVYFNCFDGSKIILKLQDLRMVLFMEFLLNGLVYKFATGDIFEMNKRGCYVYATGKYYRGIGG